MFITSKRKNRTSNSSLSDSELNLKSPEEKRIKEPRSSSSSSLDLSTDEIWDALAMAQNLGPKIELILTRLGDIDKKLEQINSSVSNLERKLDKLENKVQKMEGDHLKTRWTVDDLENGVKEINEQVNEVKAAGEKAQEVCNEKYKALEDKLLYAEVYSRRENLRFYGINEYGDVEDTLKELEVFLENRWKVNRGDIEFQRVHRVGKINEDGTPRPILARFFRYSDREFIFSKA